MAARRERGKAVDIRRIHVLERVFPAADIECVAVGQKRPSASGLNKVGHGLRVVRAQIRQVSKLTEVQLDGDDFSLKIDIPHSGCRQQLLQLLLLVQTRVTAEIGKVYLSLFHERSPLSFVIIQKYTCFLEFVNPFALPAGIAHSVTKNLPQTAA